MTFCIFEAVPSLHWEALPGAISDYFHFPASAANFPEKQNGCCVVGQHIVLLSFN